MSQPAPSTVPERETYFHWELLVRLRGTNREQAIYFLVQRDGDRCYFCHNVLDITVDHEKRLATAHGVDVHHLDYNQRNNKRNNLRLPHHDCNSADQARHRMVQPATTLPQREREKATVAAELLSQEKPRTVELNEEYEDAFRSYIVTRLLMYGPDPDPDRFIFLVPRNLLPAAAEWIGANPKTCYPYLARMTNPENGFVTRKPYRKTGKEILCFGDMEYYSLEAEEILRRHPKRGLRTFLGLRG